MKIIIKYTNLDSTPSIKKYVEEKIGSTARFIQRWDKDDVIEANVELARRSFHHRKGDVFKAEVNLRLPGKMLRAVERDYDIRVAIDKVKNKLHSEVKKYKELREQSVGRRTARRRTNQE
jgi:ribosomal subunit interface protein